MRIPWVFMSSFLAMFTFGRSSLIFLTVIVGDPVTFPCNRTCFAPVEWTKVLPSQAFIAGCNHHQNCSFGDAVKNRVQISNGRKPSLIFSSTVYNDIGAYECKCNGKSICDVKLKVLVSITIRANVLDQVTLPCFWNTFKDTIDFQWERDDKLVLHYKSGKLTTGEGFDENFSLYDEGYKEGNLSLTINQVQLSDAGLYRCHINEKWDEGYPHSYILIVKEKNEEDNQSACHGTVVGFVVAVVAAVIFGALLVVFVIPWRKIIASKTTKPKQLEDSVAKGPLPHQEVHQVVPLENVQQETVLPKTRLRINSLSQLSRTWSNSFQNAARNSDNKEKEGLLSKEELSEQCE